MTCIVQRLYIEYDKNMPKSLCGNNLTYFYVLRDSYQKPYNVNLFTSDIIKTILFYQTNTFIYVS